MAETNKENVMDYLLVKPKDAVKIAESALDKDNHGDRALAVATLASAIMVRNGLLIVAGAIETFDKNEQERAISRGKA